MKKRNNTITVNVLKNFDGRTNNELLETIERKYTLFGGYRWTNGVRHHTEKRKQVSYKGKLHTVFALHDAYTVHGLCINAH